MDLDLASADRKGEGRRVLYVSVDGPVYDPPLEDQGVVSDEGDVLP